MTHTHVMGNDGVFDPHTMQADLRTKSASDGGSGVNNFLGGMGLGMLADQLKDLKLGELLDTPDRKSVV